MSNVTRRGLFAAMGATGGSIALAPLLARAQGADSEESQYIGSILAIANMMTWFFDEEVRFTSNYDPALLLDEEWRVDVLAPFAVARAAQVVLLDIEPPPVYAESYDLFVESVDNAVLSGDSMKTGVLNVDAAAIQTAAEYLGRSSDLIIEATEALPSAAEVAG